MTANKTNPGPRTPSPTLWAALAAFILAAGVFVAVVITNGDEQQPQQAQVAQTKTTSKVTEIIATDAPKAVTSTSYLPTTTNIRVSAKPTTTQARRTTTSTTTTTRPRPTTTRSPYNTSVYFELTYDYKNYLCQEKRFTRNTFECVRYFGGGAPGFYDIDLYCTGSKSRLDCSTYDPDEYFEIRYDGTTYLCNSLLLGKYECARYSSGSLPSFYSPDLYCSGSESYPECSKYWFPSDLEMWGREIRNISGTTYLCDQAMGSYRDWDCNRYSGGDPSFISFSWPDLKCTEEYGSLSCNRDYYPSEMEGLSIVRIDFSKYICKSTFQGDECFRCWSDCSPDDVGYWPDYYCNYRGCSPDGYPSGY